MSSKKKAKQPAAPTVVDQMTLIKNKFSRLAQVRAQLAALKVLYAEHDSLVSELMPLFIEKTNDAFIVKRQITLGNTTHRLVPYFYDDKKGILKAKCWKSTAMETMAIE
jgi:hypothetical protein